MPIVDNLSEFTSASAKLRMKRRFSTSLKENTPQMLFCGKPRANGKKARK